METLACNQAVKWNIEHLVIVHFMSITSKCASTDGQLICRISDH